MIYLNDNLCPGGLYQMPDLFDNQDKIGNLKFRWLVVFWSNNNGPKDKKNGLILVAGKPTSIRKILVGCGINYHCSKAKFLGGV